MISAIANPFRFAGCAGLFLAVVLAPVMTPSNAHEADIHLPLPDRLHGMAESTLQTALESRRSGETLFWLGETSSFGSVTPLRTWRSRSGHFCRAFEEEVRADKAAPQLEQSVACRESDGIWKRVKD